MQPTTRYFELTASEFEWNLSEEKTIKAWGFNNTVPGPQLRANIGDTMVIKVKNNLPEPTIVHWHGIRLPASMDGTAEVQRPIEPGEEFEYRFTVPDAGTFWYHSHHNETEQMERGMYGSLIVEEESDLVVDAERTFMIDDMKLTEKNEFRKGNFAARWMERHDGSEGSTLLLNGKENTVIDINAGQTERWRFINSSSARYFLLQLGGKKFQIIGTDGGLIEKPVTVTEALIVPGERLEILVSGFEENEIVPLMAAKYDRMTFLKAKRNKFATIVTGKAKPSVARIPEVLRKIESLTGQDALVTREVKMSVIPSIKKGIDFVVNGEVHANDKPVNMGDLQVWEVSNTSMMDHPFHLHGYFFQVLEENGKASEYISWKDTVNLKPRSKVKIAWMPDRAGIWMYHCHILEHHAAGMMANFEVIDPAVGEKHHGQHACHA